jgi:glycerol kinase
MRRDSGQEISVIRVDGGMVANDWMCQFLADLTGIAVERPAVNEATALGAALLAGLQAGVFSSPEDIGRGWQRERIFEPALEPARRDELYAGWQRAVRRLMG